MRAPLLGAWSPVFARVPAFLHALTHDRWFGLAVASWVEACAGVSYMFSLYSQSFKDQFGYNQQLVDLVGMAKDIGGNVGIVSGWVGDVAPTWVVLAIGAAQNFVGYGLLWLLLAMSSSSSSSVTSAPRWTPPVWLVMVLMCVGTNGATFFNTASLVTCVKNFPTRRGPVVGLLKVTRAAHWHTARVKWSNEIMRCEHVWNS